MHDAIAIPVWLLLPFLIVFGSVITTALRKNQTIPAAVATLEAGVVSDAKSIDAAVVTALMAAEKDGKAVAGTVQSYIDGFIAKVKSAV
jgi:hypothetical protein